MRRWLPILALCLLASARTRAQGSSGPESGESPPASTPPARLYTEEEALAAASEAAKTALDLALPLAVQAAVAEERCAAAAQRILAEAEAEAARRQARSWRNLALVSAGAGSGCLVGGLRGGVCGAIGGASVAAVWWLLERCLRPERSGTPP
ncbi:MAG: hypothetical protein M0Z80_15300 [Treponema sp.]|nr:hypothetical protein [Treponema sp.]